MITSWVHSFLVCIQTVSVTKLVHGGFLKGERVREEEEGERAMERRGREGERWRGQEIGEREWEREEEREGARGERG